MFSIFEFIFYRIYVWKKRQSKEDMPLFTAILAVSAIQSCLSLILIFIIEIFLEKYILGRIVSSTVIAAYFIIIAFINYFIYSKNYINIEKKYSKISKEKTSDYQYLCGLYYF